MNANMQVRSLSTQNIIDLIEKYGTPLYVYDEKLLRAKCRAVLAIPSAFGLYVGYAMKANSSRALLEIIASENIGIDASSFNEVQRAIAANIKAQRIMLTTQDIPMGDDRKELECLMKEGLLYNVCSQQQLELIADFVQKEKLPISVRVNPGIGTGESVTRNTGDDYSSFGNHLGNIENLLAIVRERKIVVKQVHCHIGSGGDPQVWRANIERMLEITERYFPEAKWVNLGGGFKEARMPDESAADINELGIYAKQQFEAFAARTGRQLTMVVEPGTFLIANAGYVVAVVIDKKTTGQNGFEFLILDAGMETITRPLLYGSRHPFYVVSRDGCLLSSEFDPQVSSNNKLVVAGRCCESGDSQTLDAQGHIAPRAMANPNIGDYVIIGGAGAYCSSMSLVGYNSYTQAAEVLVREDGSLQLIRKRQTLLQLCQNELPL
ncbi:MAG: diaminopimelate decarboxylase [Deltaproteobacteria bacterium]|nr:diaminopimelate decarboxylase [Deltaproteobacteria bacterium]